MSTDPNSRAAPFPPLSNSNSNFPQSPRAAPPPPLPSPSHSSQAAMTAARKATTGTCEGHCKATMLSRCPEGCSECSWIAHILLKFLCVLPAMPFHMEVRVVGWEVSYGAEFVPGKVVITIDNATSRRTMPRLGGSSYSIASTPSLSQDIVLTTYILLPSQATRCGYFQSDIYTAIPQVQGSSSAIL